MIKIKRIIFKVLENNFYNLFYTNIMIIIIGFNNKISINIF